MHIYEASITIQHDCTDSKIRVICMNQQTWVAASALQGLFVSGGTSAGLDQIRTAEGQPLAGCMRSLPRYMSGSDTSVSAAKAAGCSRSWRHLQKISISAGTPAACGALAAQRGRAWSQRLPRYVETHLETQLRVLCNNLCCAHTASRCCMQYMYHTEAARQSQI